MSNEKKRTFTRNGLKQPCEQECPDRKPGCGASCEKWKAYVAKRNEEYQRRAVESEKGRATAASKRASRNALYRNPKKRNG
jgi:hypothetical protein